MIATLAGEMLAGAALAAGGYAYAAMWPASQIFGRTLIAPRRPGQLALTFDDGPNPAWTPQLVDLLASYNVKATFFFVGKYAQSEPILTRYVADAGHLIGIHTWSHPNLALCSGAQIRSELARTKDAIEQITGKPARFFRPPFGGRRPAVLRIARELGLTPVLWNAMTNDWKEPSPERIASRLSDRIDALHRHGYAANIVLHDGGHVQLGVNRGASFAAAGKLLRRYAASHEFVTLASWS